jgi:mannose-6-phosphate isomerase-like protein (cupin superfamily)
MEKTRLKTRNLHATIVIMVMTFFLTGCNNQPAQDEEKSDPQKAKIQSDVEDMGKKPWVLDIEEVTIDNEHYRLANWTGENIQLVLMSLNPGEEINLEMHSDRDQFIRIEQGEARVRMGKTEDKLSFNKTVSDDWAILVTGGYWHHIENIGDTELKLYSIYGPPEHEKGTLHPTYEDAEEHHHHHEETDEE